MLMTLFAGCTLRLPWRACLREGGFILSRVQKLAYHTGQNILTSELRLWLELKVPIEISVKISDQKNHRGQKKSLPSLIKF